MKDSWDFGCTRANLVAGCTTTVLKVHMEEKCGEQVKCHCCIGCIMRVEVPIFIRDSKSGMTFLLIRLWLNDCGCKDRCSWVKKHKTRVITTTELSKMLTRDVNVIFQTSGFKRLGFPS